MSSGAPLPVGPDEQPQLRLSDAERDRVAEFLRVQAAEGRLTLIELEERLDQVYAARIRADLNGVTDGLPVPSPVHRPPTQAVAPRRSRADDPSFGPHLRTYLVFCAFFVLIWLFTGAGYFWPIWPALGWGIGVASHWAATPRRDRGEQGRPAAR